MLADNVTESKDSEKNNNNIDTAADIASFQDTEHEKKVTVSVSVSAITQNSVTGARKTTLSAEKKEEIAEEIAEEEEVAEDENNLKEVSTVTSIRADEESFILEELSHSGDNPEKITQKLLLDSEKRVNEISEAFKQLVENHAAELNLLKKEFNDSKNSEDIQKKFLAIDKQLQSLFTTFKTLGLAIVSDSKTLAATNDSEKWLAMEKELQDLKTQLNIFTSVIDDQYSNNKDERVAHARSELFEAISEQYQNRQTLQNLNERNRLSSNTMPYVFRSTSTRPTSSNRAQEAEIPFRLNDDAAAVVLRNTMPSLRVRQSPLKRLNSTDETELNQNKRQNVKNTLTIAQAAQTAKINVCMLSYLRALAENQDEISNRIQQNESTAYDQIHNALANLRSTMIRGLRTMDYSYDSNVGIWQRYFGSSDPIDRAIDSIERFANNPRFSTIPIKTPPGPLASMADSILDMRAVFYAICLFEQDFRKRTLDMEGVEIDQGINSTRSFSYEHGNGSNRNPIEGDEEKLQWTDDNDADAYIRKLALDLILSKDANTTAQKANVIVGSQVQKRTGTTTEYMGFIAQNINKANELFGQEDDSKKNAGTVLMCLGVAMLVSTAVLALPPMTGALAFLQSTAILSHAIQVTLSMMAAIGMPVSTTTATYMAGASLSCGVAFFGYSLKAWGGPSQLKQDYDRAWMGLQEAATDLQTRFESRIG